MKQTLLALCVLAALSSPLSAAPTTEQHIQALEARIRALEASAEAMRRQNEEAIAALQATRAEIELIKESRQATVADSDAAPVEASSAAASSANGNAFNPAISVILNGQYAHHSLDSDSDGLSLGESEIAMSANIDEKFYGQLTLAVESEDGEDALGIEEAYIDTTALPAGFTLRAGRFFSNIGYLNNHHAHTDKFSDRPLAYQAFLGDQYGDDGVQLRWVAPTELYVELGGEVLRGQNFPSGGAGNDGAGVTTLFAHVGGDIGSETSWLAGLSMLRSRTEGAEDGFTGDNRLYIADVTWKWAPDGNTKDGGIQVRGEYLLDDRDGQYVDAVDPLLDQPWVGKRRGAYVEGVYRINRNWEAGYRYDRLWEDDSGPYASDYDPFRHSVMLAWRNSEFSLLRLQLSRHNQTQVDSDTVLTLQYQTALGAHGAHKF